MKIKDNYNIGGLNVKITKKNDIAFSTKLEAISKLGMCDYDNKEIIIAIKRPQQMIELNLFHEIIEFINMHYNIELSHKQICLIESGLYQVLHDNKIVF